VKAISPDVVPSIELVRDRVEICDLGERVMKRRVEHGDLWHPGTQHGARRGDASEVVRIVQRGQIDQILDRAPPCTTRCPTASMSATREIGAADWSLASHPIKYSTAAA
jgi:hypothetical protein